MGRFQHILFVLYIGCCSGIYAELEPSYDSGRHDTYYEPYSLDYIPDTTTLPPYVYTTPRPHYIAPIVRPPPVVPVPVVPSGYYPPIIQQPIYPLPLPLPSTPTTTTARPKTIFDKWDKLLKKQHIKPTEQHEEVEAAISPAVVRPIPDRQYPSIPPAAVLTVPGPPPPLSPVHYSIPYTVPLVEKYVNNYPLLEVDHLRKAILELEEEIVKIKLHLVSHQATLGTGVLPVVPAAVPPVVAQPLLNLSNSPTKIVRILKNKHKQQLVATPSPLQEVVHGW